jgi:hypothetical protein
VTARALAAIFIDVLIVVVCAAVLVIAGSGGGARCPAARGSLRTPGP